MGYFNNRDYLRYREIFRKERMPLAFVDLEKFDANVAYVASTQKETGKTIRVGTKSIRCIELTRRIFQRGGDRYRGILAFTMEEAAFLAKRGFNDILVAYPTTQAADIDLMVQLSRSRKKVILMTDSMEHLMMLNAAGERFRTVLSACMEVDMAYRPFGPKVHLGLRRSPIRSAEDALVLARAAKELRWVRITAIMGYEGHIAGLGDNHPGRRLKNAVLRTLKKASIREFTPRRDHIAELLRAEGLPVTIVNGGGSGSLVSSGADPVLTEVAAGSAFYCPALFHHFREVRFQPAAFFAVQVVRRPAPDMVTCLGGGYTASGGTGPDRLPVPVLPTGLKLLPMEGAGEVQTPLVLPRDAPRLEPGDPVFFQHAKAGELCERFNELYLIEGDRIVRKVKTYRGEGKAFL